MILEDYVRITDTDFVCPVCGKADWCLVAKDGKSAICNRIESKSKWACGFYHQITLDTDKLISIKKAKKEKKVVSMNWVRLKSDYSYYLHTSEEIEYPTFSSQTTLNEFGIGWDGEAWTFPMYDGLGQITGIQRRYPSGEKRYVKGSVPGIFRPTNCEGYWPNLYIFEGLSDATTAFDLTYMNTIGRPSCNTGAQCIYNYIYTWQCKNAYIISDNDKVGIAGSRELAELITPLCNEIKLIIPPLQYKDFRDWANSTSFDPDDFDKIIELTANWKG